MDTNTTNTEAQPKQHSRRDFLKLAWLGLGGLALAETGVMSMAFFQPRLAEGEFGSMVTAGTVVELPLELQPVCQPLTCCFATGLWNYFL